MAKCIGREIDIVFIQISCPRGGKLVLHSKEAGTVSKSCIHSHYEKASKKHLVTHIFPITFQAIHKYSDTMTQITSPRQQLVIKRIFHRNSVSRLLWLGIFLVGLCTWNLRPDPEVSLSSPSTTIGGTQSAFDWSHIEVSIGVPGKCGADKCFWRSTSDPDSVGYLVASAKHNYKRMKASYEFAVDILNGKCNAQHLFLQEPQLVRIDPPFARRLNSLIQNDHNDFADQKGTPMKVGNVFSEKDPFVVVQKVKVAPKPNLMFGFMQSKWEMMVEQGIPRFREELNSRGISLPTIEEKLESERKGIECACEYSKTYWYDLQGLIDLEGNYFHMDIDSQYWVKIGDPYHPEDTSVMTITRATNYQRRHGLIGRFNEMIQRLVYPPPEGIDELPAWREGEGPEFEKQKLAKLRRLAH